MKISKNDPRLTAYVLNELDALEKSMIENALQADSELQNEVAQIKKSIGVFQTLAKPQAEMELSKAQREKIFERPSSAPGWSIWTIGGSLATACLAVMLFQQKAHERPEFPVPVPLTAPLSKTVSATPPPPQAEAKKAAPTKEQVANIEQQAPAEVSAGADNFESDNPAAWADSKRAEPQEYESAKNSMAGALGASGAGSATGSRADYGASIKSKSATAVARPMVAARMAKDEAAAPPAAAAPTQARGRLQEMPRELDVSLSQFLPTETEPGDVEISMNLTRDLKKCFSENLSKYVRYNLKFNLNWTMQKTKATNVRITDAITTGLITAEIQSCVQQSFESQNWSEVKFIREALKPLQLEAVVTIVSE